MAFKKTELYSSLWARQQPISFATAREVDKLDLAIFSDQRHRIVMSQSTRNQVPTLAQRKLSLSMPSSASCNS